MSGKIMNVLAYIIENGSMTVRDGNLNCGTTETRVYMSQLIKLGYPIRSVWENGVDINGEPVRYKRYIYAECPAD